VSLETRGSEAAERGRRAVDRITVPDAAAVIDGRRRQRTNRRAGGAALAALVAAAAIAIGVAARSPATTRVQVRSNGANTTIPTAARHVVADLGACSTNTPGSLATLNPGVSGVAKKIVPITALNVRVCRYPRRQHVVETLLSSPTVVAQFEAETNRLPVPPPNLNRRLRGGKPCASPSWYFLTFANDSQRIDVIFDGCRLVSNGTRDVRPTTRWLNDLHHRTAATRGTILSEIVGTWRPVSIAGYTGPLVEPPLNETPALRFDNKGTFSGNDGCNDFSGSYQLGNGGTFHFGQRSATLKRCPRRTPPPPESAARVELLDGRLTFFDRVGQQVAQYEPANVAARVVLSSRTLTAGASMSAQVIVENGSAHAIHAVGCGSLFAVALNNTKIHQSPLWPLCGQDFTIPVGRSSYPVTVSGAYLACSHSRPAGYLPPCLPNNRFPPLPAGQYEAELFQSSNIASIPPPIPVRVTPRASVP